MKSKKKTKTITLKRLRDSKTGELVKLEVPVEWLPEIERIRKSARNVAKACRDALNLE